MSRSTLDKARAWEAAADELERNYGVLHGIAGMDRRESAIVDHIVEVIVPSLRQRARIVRRNKPRRGGGL